MGKFCLQFFIFLFFRQNGSSRNVHRDEEEVNFINHKIFQYVIKENMHHRFPILKKIFFLYQNIIQFRLNIFQFFHINNFGFLL